MSKKIEIEKLNHGWLLTVQDDLKNECSAYESPGNLLMGIATALSGGATRLKTDKPNTVAVECREFK